MSDTKWTPGLWKRVIRNDNEAMVSYHGVTIGMFYNDISTKTSKNDADLIAAAPDLYEALENLMSANGGGPKACGHDFDCICANDKAKLALAKARGEHND